MSIIFHGAGGEARRKLAEWRSAGLIPDCFSDRDAKKHHTRFPAPGSERPSEAAYDVLPLDEAIARHPDYLIYVTLHCRHLLEATEWLIAKGVPRDRIRFADPVKRRKGCPYLRRFLLLGANAMTSCCSPFGPCRIRGVDIKDDITGYLTFYEQIEAKMAQGAPSACDGCPVARDDFYPIDPKIEEVAFITDFADDVCNFKCVFCYAVKNGHLGRKRTPPPKKASATDIHRRLQGRRGVFSGTR